MGPLQLSTSAGQYLAQLLRPRSSVVFKPLAMNLSTGSCFGSQAGLARCFQGEEASQFTASMVALRKALRTEEGVRSHEKHINALHFLTQSRILLPFYGPYHTETAGKDSTQQYYLQPQ